MPSAFFTGLSGLRAHARAVEVVANNLANLNTLSFKSSRSDFRDLFYQQIGQSRSGVASQVGIGAAPITVSRRFEQGTIQNTGGLLDAAIQGEGFFVVRDGGATQYTRAGNFQLQPEPGAGHAQTARPSRAGFETAQPASSTLSAPSTPLRYRATIASSPRPPRIYRLPPTFRPAPCCRFPDPFRFSIPLGSPHILTMTFTPVAPTGTNSAAFELSTSLPASELIDLNTLVAPLADPNLLAGQPVVIEFDQNGALVVPAVPYAATIDMTAVAAPAGIGFANGAAQLNISWNFLDSLSQPRITSVAAASAVTDLFQDGSASAELTSISVSDGGEINGIFSDGRSLLLAQLAMARFTNPQALQAVGNNNYVPTSAAGLPITGTANTGGLGSIVGLSLESSNVDIAQEFTNLLTYQRGFQANSRVITTADELNQEALNLKR